MDNYFPSCGSSRLGLYPIVDSVDWITKLLPLGINTIQLRIKNKSLTTLENEIEESVALARHYNARLFINDYWDLAIRYGAYGVHLGQEDLETADLNAIYKAGLRLGVSTHSEDEVEKVLIIKPSYIAFGPIFPTTSKTLVFGPLGIEKLTYWSKKLSYPVVAIGGINIEHLSRLVEAGVSGVAVIAALSKAENPITMAQDMMDFFNE